MTHLNAGFGSPIGADDLSLIATLGFRGVRQDVPSVTAVSSLVREFAHQPLSPCFVAGGSHVPVARALARAIRAYALPDAAIEVGNELDAVMTAQAFGALVARAYEAIRQESGTVRVVSGGITNTSRTAIDWLAEAVERFPADVTVGYHSYRGHPDEPKRGFRSRAEEFAALREVAKDRPLWCTEFGYHTASRRVCFGIKRKGLSDFEVADYVARDLQLQREAGVEMSVLYQLNDGPTDKPIDRYGIRTVDGALKPVAYVVKGVA